MMVRSFWSGLMPMNVVLRGRLHNIPNSVFTQTRYVTNDALDEHG